MKRVMNNRPDEWQPRFIEALRELGHVGDSCQLAKVSKQTVYNYRRDDPDFAAAWDAAIEDAAWSLEDEAWRRCRDGVDKPIIYKGMITGTMKEYSDTLLMFMLKGIKPDKFADKFILRLSPEQLAILQKLGLSASDVFEMAIQEIAAAQSEVKA